MQLNHLYTSKMHTNTYIVSNGDEAFIVDPGDNADDICALLKRLGKRLVAILLTHGHFDHIGAVKRLTEVFVDNSPQVMIHSADLELISTNKNMGSYLGVDVEPFVPDLLLKGGETITVAGLKIDVIHTPGHTEGGVCYKVEDKIFTGDTIFYCSYGRTDLFGGDFAALKNAIINKLFRLQGNFMLLPGHGEPTTLDFERKNNPILTDKNEQENK